MTIQEKIQTLIEIRSEVNYKISLIDEAKARRDALQNEIITDMKNIGFNTVKAGNTSVAIAKRKSLKIADEKKFIEFLKAKGLANEYVSERPNQYCQVYLNEAAKQNLQIDGTELHETEYISIRQNKEKDEA